MKYDLNKSKEAIRAIGLSSEEKGALWARLVLHVDEHPPRFIPSPYYRFFHSRVTYALFGALLMFSITSTGVALAAEGSLPGDLLYPVKIYVTEPVRGALVTDVVQQAQWVEEKAQRRLDEAASLAAQGRLSTTTAEALTKDVEENTDEFHTLVQQVQRSDTAASEKEIKQIEDIHATLNAELEMHARVLPVATSSPAEDQTSEDTHASTSGTPSRQEGTREQEQSGSRTRTTTTQEQEQEHVQSTNTQTTSAGTSGNTGIRTESSGDSGAREQSTSVERD